MLPAAAHFMTGGAQQPVRTVMRSDYSPDTNPVPSPQNSVFRTNLVPPNTQSYAPQTAYSRSIVPQELPLRMVVNAKHVGAIIGQGGSKIREITNESGARCVVDSYKSAGETGTNFEKVIAVQGQLENCVQACTKILEVVNRELEKETSKAPPIELRFRIPNTLVGRLIGKSGVSVKRLMEETCSSISISDSREMERRAAQGHGADQHVNSERTVTIKAQSMEAVSQSVRTVFARLRQFFESDLQLRNLPSSALSLTNVSTISLGQTNSHGDVNGYIPTSVGSGHQLPILIHSHTPPVAPPNIANISNLQKVNIYVPNAIVGALIGAKGSHIRNMMRLTGAVIRIEANFDIGSSSSKESVRSDKEAPKESKSEEPEESNVAEPKPVATTDPDANGVELAQSVVINGSAGGLKPSQSLSAESSSETSEIKERCVTITGTDQQIFKAEFWIFQRVAEYSVAFIDETPLNSMLTVPTSIVGRIIGRNGANVKELQRITQAIVKICEEPAGDQLPEREETTVRIIGNFFSTQAVQARLSHLIADYRLRNSTDHQSVSDQPTQASEQDSVDTAIAPSQPDVAVNGP